MAAAYVEVSFGTWAMQISPHDHVELNVSTDSMVITNAALVTFREEGRSSLKLNFMKREDIDNGDNAMLCSLMPRSVESVSLGVRLGRQETYIVENTGINVASAIDVTGHYIGYVSVPGTADKGAKVATHSHSKVVPSQKRKRESGYKNTKQVAFKSHEVRKEPVKGSYAQKTGARQTTASVSTKPVTEHNYDKNEDDEDDEEEDEDDDEGEDGEGWEVEDEDEDDDEDEDEDEEEVPPPKKKKALTARK
ncbi:hypothetical protein IW262DRAFT_1302962 [Armillaria fumosa]|nr:hypothetical protein IW262DRAFT_1302962 [Armillaria fumosa]